MNLVVVVGRNDRNCSLSFVFRAGGGVKIEIAWSLDYVGGVLPIAERQS